MSFRTKRVLIGSLFYALLTFIVLNYLFSLFGGIDKIYTLLIAILLLLMQTVPMFFEEKTGIPCECLPEGSADDSIVIARDTPDMSTYSGPETDIYILSGCRNGKVVQYVLRELDKRGIKVRKAYLVSPVKWMIKGYYACTRFPNPFIK